MTTEFEQNLDEHIEKAKANLLIILRDAKERGIEKVPVTTIDIDLEGAQPVHFLHIWPTTEEDRERYPNIRFGHFASKEWLRENDILEFWRFGQDGEQTETRTYYAKRRKSA